MTGYYQKFIDEFQGNVNQELVDQIYKKCEVKKVKNGEEIVQTHANRRDFYFIIEGSFIRYVCTHDGEPKIIMFHTPTFFPDIGFFDSYVHGEESIYRIKANEDAVVMHLKYDFIQQLKGYDFLKDFNLMFAENLFNQVETLRVQQLALKPIDYLNWLYDNYPEFFRVFKSKDLASFMGITPVWFSKLKAQLLS